MNTKQVELLPCPFCGGSPVILPHPEVAEIVRVECVEERCALRPATEYLLARYRDELVAAWNQRRSAAA